MSANLLCLNAFFFTKFLSAYLFEIFSVHPGKKAFSVHPEKNSFSEKCKSFSPKRAYKKKVKLFIVHQWLFNIQKSITILIAFVSDALFSMEIFYDVIWKRKKTSALLLLFYFISLELKFSNICSKKLVVTFRFNKEKMLSFR